MFIGKRAQDLKRASLLAGLIVVASTAICLSACQPAPAASAQATPEPTLVPYQNALIEQGFVELVTNDFLPPVLPEKPMQADFGEEPYYLVCMACHGDWGQGLTDEWRQRGFGEEAANCWQSQCHGSNHPDHGFVLPKSIPPILGYGNLARYSNAQQLFEVIYETMPWWDPGSLSEAEAWSLTAYLMRARGEIRADISLNAGNAPIYRLHVPAPALVDERYGVVALLVTLTISTVAFVWKGS